MNFILFQAFLSLFLDVITLNLDYTPQSLLPHVEDMVEALLLLGHPGHLGQDSPLHLVIAVELLTCDPPLEHGERPKVAGSGVRAVGGLDEELDVLQVQEQHGLATLVGLESAQKGRQKCGTHN